VLSPEKLEHVVV